MTKAPTPHPLVPWLAKKGLKPYKFAAKHKLSSRPLYAHIKGEGEHPSLRIMEAIEKATKGAVSVDAQIKWSRRNRQRLARAAAAEPEEVETEEPDVVDEPEDVDNPIDDDADDPREDAQP